MSNRNIPSEISLTIDTKTLKELWPYLWPTDLASTMRRLILSFASLLSSKIILLLIPYFFKLLVDTFETLKTSDPHPSVLTSSVPIKIIGGLIGSYLVARVLTSLLYEVREALFVRVTQRAARRIALRVFQHLHNLSLRFHLDRQTGGLSRSIERGTKGIENLLHFLTLIVIPTFIEIFLVSILLWYLYGLAFGVIIFITISIYILFTLLMTQWRIQFVRQMNLYDNQCHSKAIDSLLNYETVKYFNNEQHEAKRFDEALRDYEEVAVKSKLSLSYLNIGQAVIISLGLGLTMFLASSYILKGVMTTGDLVAINAYLIQLFIPLFNLGFAFREIKVALANVESMFNILTMPQEVQDTPNAPAIKCSKGDIEFEHVSFFYTSDRPILVDVSFMVPSGKTVAIVGSSGAGKSTLARLLYRFYDVTTGKIMIDGQDIQAVTQESLRKLIAVVPQDTILFNESIKYNIAYGRPNASFHEIEEVARQAHIKEFIESLPDKYETMVGERGLKLSGGEKQRIAIARALIKKPKIFLFDEATSALDTRTEREIQQNLREISENHTTLIIAHRLSTVVDAHEIIVLDNGNIVEKGTHKALLAKKGMYAKMWERQQQSQDNVIEVNEAPVLR